MTSAPVFFAVERTPIGETPVLYHEQLPRDLRSLVYIVRLDDLPNADKLLAASLRDLYAVYMRLMRSGKLPPRYEPPKRKADAGATTIKYGERRQRWRKPK